VGGGGNALGGAGTINTGGGGGGNWTYGQAGGAGGSGVVILRSKRQAFATTGSPTYTTFSDYHIYTFNGSGSITF
jgi:hypothetical protein